MSKGKQKHEHEGHEVFHQRLRDWDCPDKITFEIVPRYKTGFVGSEWRTSVKVTAFFKGEVIGERSWRDMAAAMLRAPVWIADELCCPLSDQVVDLERAKCDQPGCAQDAVSTYLLRQLYSDTGERIAEDEKDGFHYERHFCQRHLLRGDQSNEDSDQNYLVIRGPGPSAAAGWQEDEAPARTVVVQADSPEDLVEKIAKAKKDGDL
jgi:hypothetical protein